MKKLLSFLLLSIATSAFCQQIKCNVKKSALLQDMNKNAQLVTMEEDGSGGTILVRSKQEFRSPKKTYFFEHYDKDMKLVKSSEFEVERGELLGAMLREKKISLVEFIYDKKRKAYVCTASTATIDDFSFNRKELFSLERKEVQGLDIAYYGLGYIGNFDKDFGAAMMVNKDHTAFAVTVDIDDKNNNETHRIYVFDGEFNQKINHVFKRDIKDRNFRYENIDISHDGATAYLLGKVWSKEASGKKEGGRYQYELTRITASGSTSKTFDTDDHFATTLRAVLTDAKIACVGFYSDKKDGLSKGICYFGLDPVSLSLKDEKFNPFTPQFLNDKFGQVNTQEIKNLFMKSLIVTAENEIIFNAEEKFITRIQMPGTSGGVSSYETYHFNDIVCAKLDSNGALAWARNIQKDQVSAYSEDEFTSYTSVYNNGKVYFLINCSNDLEKLSNGLYLFPYKKAKKADIYLLSLDSNGNFDHKKILDNESNEIPFMVGFGFGSVNGSNSYFLANKGSKKQLLRLTF